MAGSEEEALLNSSSSDGRPKSSAHPNTEYVGYKPFTAADLPFDEDVEWGKGGKSKFADVDPGMLRDSPQTSVISLIFTCFLAALFIVLLVWLILISSCKVSRFCDMTDHSTMSKVPGLTTAPALRIPTAYVWASLVVASFCLTVAAAYMIVLIRKPVGSARLVEISTHILECAHALTNCQMRAYLLPVITMFLLIGFGLSWIFAGGFMFGSMITKIAGNMCVNVATRANLRTTAAAKEGTRSGAGLAFRAGSIVGLMITGLGLLGVSVVYLMLEDSRVLAGFAAGTGAVALICRVIGSIYISATSMGSRLMNLIRGERRPDEEPHLPLQFMETGGECLGDVTGVSLDLLETYVSAIAVTAILGSLLPFFYRDPYGVCVFNHLYVDLFCGSFGYPQELSYAIYICRRDNMYLQYPSLSTWQSNSVFIALPFVVASMGLVAAVLCTIRVHSPSAEAEQEPDKASQIHTLLWGFRINLLLGALILVCGAAGACFGLLGRGSRFQSGAGLGSVSNIDFFQLSPGPKESACQLFTNSSAGVSDPFPVPMGNVVRGRYKPVSVLGFAYDFASSSDWRLFLCIVIGIALALLLEYCTEFFTSASSKPVTRVAESAEFGACAIIIQGLATGMLSAMVPVLLVGFSIMGTYALYGAYGIALSSVGVLAGLGIVIAADSFGPIASSAGQMARLAGLSEDIQDVTATLEAAGRTNTATGKLLSNASGMITCVAFLAPMMFFSGLAPGSRDIIGSSDISPVLLIGSVVPISLSSIFVSVALVLGVMMPFLFSGLLLASSSKAANAIVVGTREHIDTVEDMQRKGDFAKTRLMSCLGSARRTSFFESVLPITAILITPFIIGFGFGQKALISFLIAVTGSTFVLGTIFSDTGEMLGNALKLIELGAMGEGNGRGSAWHESALVADAVGKSLKDTAGSAMNIVMKLVVFLGYLGIQRMNPGAGKGWVGAVIFALYLFLIVPFSAWKWNRNMRLLESARGHTDDKIKKPPPKQTSPFFEKKPTVHPSEAAPGSQLADALYAVGDPKTAVDPEMLPGLSTRTRADFSGVQRGDAGNVALPVAQETNAGGQADDLVASIDE